MSDLHVVRTLRQALAALRDVADSNETRLVVRALIGELERELRAEEEAVIGLASGEAVETASTSPDGLRDEAFLRKLGALAVA